MGRIVGLDFGTARLGVAVSDARCIIATPLKTLSMSKNPQETLQELKRQLAAYTDIERIVVGLPLMLSGKEGEMALKVRAFGALLEKHFPYPVVFWDERLTSAGVEKMLIGCEVSRKKRAQLSDSLSAISILQNYLDSLRS